jgi:AraC-like DNA-binding protein
VLTIGEQVMGLVAALICDPETRAHLRQSLGGESRLAFCCRGADLLEFVIQHPARMILTDLWDAAGVPTAPTVRRLHTRFPSIPIIAYCSLTPGTAHELLAMMQAGVSDILFRGLDDPRQALRSALDRADERCIAEFVTDAVGALIPAEGRMVVEYCIEHARAAPTVEKIASAIGVHRKTLVNWMTQARLPPPRAVTAWCRLLLAAWLLEDPGRSVESVALDLGFGSGTELRNMLRRYTGLRPAEVRGGGGFQQVLQLFIHQRQEHAPHPELPVARPGTV